MSKTRFVCLTMLVALMVATAIACSGPKVGSQEQGRQVAEEFVKQEATFRYDGMPETLKLTSTTSIADGWKYTFEFDCLHAGYGNRMGQMMAQMITHHTAQVTVQAGRVTVALMDGKWDMMKGRLIQ